MIGGRTFRTEEARKREKKRVLLMFIGGGVGIAILFGLLVYALHHEAFRIDTVIVESNGVLTEDALRAVILKSMSGTHAFVVPNDSVVHMPMTTIIEDLKHAFPRIHAVWTDRIGIKDVAVRVEERRPTALWCGDVVPVLVRESVEMQQRAAEEAWGTCYLMDDTAFIYDRAPLYTGNIYTRYYGPLEHAEPIGQPLVTSEEFSAWQTLATTMREGAHVPVAILFTDEHDVEVYLRGGVRVLMPREELEQAYTRLVALYESTAFDTARDIEYIDLRFGTKAFVQYWDDEVPTVDERERLEP